MTTGFPVAQTVKNLPAMQGTGLDCSIRKIPWRREWQSSPVFLHREFHGEKSLVGYSTWGRKESDTTAQVTHTHTHTYTHDYMYILGKKFINWLLPNLFREVYSVIDRLSPGL